MARPNARHRATRAQSKGSYAKATAAGRTNPKKLRAGPAARPAQGKRQNAGRTRRLTTPVLVGVGLGVAAVITIVALVASGGSSGPSAAHYRFDGVDVYGGLGPEGIPLEVGPSLAAPASTTTGQTIDGVQCNTSEQVVYHNHAHLAVFVDGRPRSVPAGVGIPGARAQNTPNGPFVGSGNCFYWLHVHATDGIIHIESPTIHTYVLGQFFGIWGQPLTSTRVGSAQGPVTATVNGKRWLADPSTIPLTPHAQIVLSVGRPVVSPPAVDFAGTGL